MSNWNAARMGVLGIAVCSFGCETFWKGAFWFYALNLKAHCEQWRTVTERWFSSHIFTKQVSRLKFTLRVQITYSKYAKNLHKTINSLCVRYLNCQCLYVLAFNT
jgi:hypothetical protein